jgi:hypothetical protein
MEERLRKIEQVTGTFLERLKPFIAIMILISMLLVLNGLHKDLNIKKEIKTACGYQQSEKVFCVCEKNKVSSIYTPSNPYYINSSSLNFTGEKYG